MLDVITWMNSSLETDISGRDEQQKIRQKKKNELMTGSDGHLWMIDPAVYVGCREADLAMTELFGGCPEVFYRSYEEEFPLVPGYHDRRDLYNLYHMLNHLNLFGRGYLPEVLRILNRYEGKL